MCDPCYPAHLTLRTATAPLHELKPSIIIRIIAVGVKKIELFTEGPRITVKMLSGLGSNYMICKTKKERA
jgi:hypothetical protein